MPRIGRDRRGMSDASKPSILLKAARALCIIDLRSDCNRPLQFQVLLERIGSLQVPSPP